MKRRIVIAVIVVLLVLAGLAAVKWAQVDKLVGAMAASTQPPEAVSSAVVREEKWRNSLNTICSISAVNGVNVTPEVAGTVSQIAFESGAAVKKGDLLLRLESSSEEAQLRAAEAQAELARINAERMRQLRADTTVSQSEFDTAQANWKQLQASADALRVAIEKKTIRAPFSGRLGIRLVNLGEYVDTGDPIVSLQSLSPVYADFALPQQELAQLKTNMIVHVSADTYTNRIFEGVLTAINPDVDAGTRNVRLQATFENPDELLRPGMFARVAVLLPVEEPVLVVPATAILSAPYGDSVYVVEPGTNAPDALVVRQQFVRTGRARGDLVAVELGVKAGQRVASSGVFKLRNGMAVVESDQPGPDVSATPRPGDR
jgi:membrane fusion protein (multidrug efflux system)